MANFNQKHELQRIAAAMKCGGLVHVVYRHDDWCRFLKGKGECNCNVEVVLGNEKVLLRKQPPSA